MSAYCDIAPGHALHGPYHDKEYGYPVEDECLLFERLALEIMQAGLSWEIVLKKRSALNRAFHNFEVQKVARFRTANMRRLLANKEIIRNKLKIKAIIENANTLLQLRNSHSGFAEWLVANHPLKRTEWVSLFRKTFKFTGGEITGEFLMSIGYLPGAHRSSCTSYKKIWKLSPPWQQAAKNGFKY